MVVKKENYSSPKTKNATKIADWDLPKCKGFLAPHQLKGGRMINGLDHPIMEPQQAGNPGPHQTKHLLHLRTL